MKSATHLLLPKTFIEVWKRGEKYVREKRTVVWHADEQTIKAEVSGTEQYRIELKFAGGGISKKCTCPYAKDSEARHPACKHMVAVAIIWDGLHDISQPTAEEIEKNAIPPPLVSRAQIAGLFKNPLHADLGILRIAAEASGSWSRPHSRLPQMPRFSKDAVPFTLNEVSQAFREISRWSHRRSYDPYFCAGEMVAAFCEIMRAIKTRLPVTNAAVASHILREAQKFHYKIILELIDDSDGLHTLTEAHLHEIYETLKAAPCAPEDKISFTEKLREFETHRDDY